MSATRKARRANRRADERAQLRDATLLREVAARLDDEAFVMRLRALVVPAKPHGRLGAPRP